jgi:hypothetical protein
MHAMGRGQPEHDGAGEPMERNDPPQAEGAEREDHRDVSDESATVTGPPQADRCATEELVAGVQQRLGRSPIGLGAARVDGHTWSSGATSGTLSGRRQRPTSMHALVVLAAALTWSLGGVAAIVVANRRGVGPVVLPLPLEHGLHAGDVATLACATVFSSHVTRVLLSPWHR